MDSIFVHRDPQRERDRELIQSTPWIDRAPRVAKPWWMYWMKPTIWNLEPYHGGGTNVLTGDGMNKLG